MSEFENGPKYSPYNNGDLQYSPIAQPEPPPSSKHSMSLPAVAIIMSIVIVITSALSFLIVYNLTKNAYSHTQIVLNPTYYDIQYDVDTDMQAAAANKALRSVVDIRCIMDNYGTGKGSGVIVGKDVNNYPIIMTNRHVVVDFLTSAGNVRGDVTVSVRLAYSPTYITDGKGADSVIEVLGFDTKVDIALIKLKVPVDNIDDVIVDFGKSNALLYGQPVLSIGNALGDGLSVTNGVIAQPEFATVMSIEGDGIGAASETITARLIQHSAGINSGNSGGALVDMSGALVGINTYSRASTDTNEVNNVNYALPVNTMRAVMDNILRNVNTASPKDSVVKQLNFSSVPSGDSFLINTVQSKELGLTFQLAPTDSLSIQLPYFLVGNVTGFSLAAKAGISKGDRIYGVGAAKFFDEETGRYIYSPGTGYPSSLVMEELMYYYGKTDKGLGALTFRIKKSSGSFETVTINGFYLQQEIPFLKA